jgi:hypothetical protein
MVSSGLSATGAAAGSGAAAPEDNVEARRIIEAHISLVRFCAHEQCSYSQVDATSIGVEFSVNRPFDLGTGEEAVAASGKSRTCSRLPAAGPVCSASRPRPRTERISERAELGR